MNLYRDWHMVLDSLPVCSTVEYFKNYVGHKLGTNVLVEYTNSFYGSVSKTPGQFVMKYSGTFETLTSSQLDPFLLFNLYRTQAGYLSGPSIDNTILPTVEWASKFLNYFNVPNFIYHGLQLHVSSNKWNLHTWVAWIYCIVNQKGCISPETPADTVTITAFSDAYWNNVSMNDNSQVETDLITATENLLNTVLGITNFDIQTLYHSFTSAISKLIPEFLVSWFKNSFSLVGWLADFFLPAPLAAFMHYDNSFHTVLSSFASTISQFVFDTGVFDQGSAKFTKLPDLIMLKKIPSIQT